MRDILGESLNKLNKIRTQKTRMTAILLALSLVVSLDVFWSLKRPGLTLAGTADCGIIEHRHSEECMTGETICELTEHTHSISCYSDDTADTETPLDWQKMFADYPYTGDLRTDLVGIANTQVGYSESTLNFKADSAGTVRGYTRYGAWYGMPYADWSAMFVSYCLNYAGADPSENPGNTGAYSMAELWKGKDKFAAIGKYDPLPGDIVFFHNNTVGIVADTYNSTFYVIRGDIDNAVCGDVLSLTDESIAGWGITEGNVHEHDNTSRDYLFDISNGPAFFIFEGGTFQKPTKRFSFKAARTIIDLIEYLENNGGSYFLTLLDNNNQELPKDGSGNYIVQPDVRYKLTISFTSPDGLVPGTFQYRIPSGTVVDSGEGNFVLKDNTEVGNWSVSEDGLITLYFNEHMDSHTEITISATIGLHFPQQDDPIDFDGKITVTVQKPEEEKELTEISKWGSQGNEATAGKTDPNKIYWTVLVKGHKDSSIPGSTLSDKTVSGEWLGDHKYTSSDIAAGLTFGVSETDPETGQELNWHKWIVSPDDPNLTWTETGWSYKIPETVVCEWCGELTLGNDGWTYMVDYTSTPLPSSVAGSMGYMNRADIDEQFADGWASFTHGTILGEVVKKGSFVSDAIGGAFVWELQATIPGIAEGEKAEYYWFIMDYMDVRDSEGNLISYITNDANNSTVTANYNGTTITVPRIQDATESDPFAWENYWSSERNGIYCGRQLNIVCKCNCTEETCMFWEDGHCCSEYWFVDDHGQWIKNGYCYCWTEEETTTFTFTYKTKGVDAIESFGGLGYRLRNEAILYNRPNGTTEGVVISNAQDLVKIPGIFKKDLTHDFDGYTANYKITVNEGKLVLTDGSPLTIHDVMSETLVYISGSLIITAEDANGIVTTLKQGTDYTVTYDGTGSKTDIHGRPVHVLDIVILHPQPVMYTLDYDTTLTIPTGITEAVKYSNSASVSIWGDKITDPGVEKVYANINIAAKHYRLEVYKTSSLTGEPLSGAVFGMFNEQGGLITSAETPDTGQIVFKSSIIEGIILRDHTLYYLQELKAPPGYQLDDTKLWFCFCNNDEDACLKCSEILAGKNGRRILLDQTGDFRISNDLLEYDLPATGGAGISPLMLVSVAFIAAPLIYISIQRRKRGRRSTG